MIEVIVIGEGQTEETFVREVLVWELAAKDIALHARLIRTSKYASGGALNWDRVSRFLRNTLRERDDTYVTTFFDLYGLGSDFPGFAECQHVADSGQRALALEATFGEAVVRLAGCREDRFLPHIQPYEFEALLFSDLEVFAEVEAGWQAFLEPLRKARDEAASPEHINEGAETHPSARLIATLRPRYQKVLHGSALTARIGINRIRQECRHFDGWLSKIERLAPLTQ